MVFYFTTTDPSYVIYMGKDKFENEHLIRFAFPEDVWFHVDDVSSAHVYLRLKKGQTMNDIPEAVLEDCCQLVKANSITGVKMPSVTIIYTPASNLKKTAGLDIGTVMFHDQKLVRSVKNVKRAAETVKRLEKTQVERFPDLQAEKEKREAEDKAERKAAIIKQKQEEVQAKEQKKKELEQRSYSTIMKEENMMSNKGRTAQDLEDDFM